MRRRINLSSDPRLKAAFLLYDEKVIERRGLIQVVCPEGSNVTWLPDLAERRAQSREVATTQAQVRGVRANELLSSVAVVALIGIVSYHLFNAIVGHDRST